MGMEGVIDDRSRVEVAADFYTAACGGIPEVMEEQAAHIEGDLDPDGNAGLVHNEIIGGDAEALGRWRQVANRLRLRARDLRRYPEASAAIWPEDPNEETACDTGECYCPHTNCKPCREDVVCCSTIGSRGYAEDMRVSVPRYLRLE